ncbi:CoA transferase [Micrococcus luteus]|nr:CoA transferase [Micrococcus luteus]
MTQHQPEFTGPLDGIKVLDLSKILAGPYATMSLADLGAEVIKVEHPEGGDPTRHWGPPFMGEDATYYFAANRGKRSVTIDLKSEEGQRVVFRMLEEADVVVENFKPGSGLQRIFDYRALSERFPQLVVLHISAFGDEGPLKDEPGYDMIAQAAGGLMSLTGEAGGKPYKSGFAIGDLGASLFGLIGLLAALVERSRTGRGQYVTTSLYEGQLALHAAWATHHFATGERPVALGSRHANLAPYQAYATQDGYIVIAAGNNALWQKLCAALARPDLAVDPDFTENSGRVVNVQRLEQELEKSLAENTVDYWYEHFTAAGVPSSPIRSLDQVYAHPHTVALDIIQTVEHPAVGSVRQIAFPVNFRGQRPPVTVAPPEFGADNDEILARYAPHKEAAGA